METVATFVEVVGFLFILAVSAVGIVLKVKDDITGWRKHMEAYHYWKSIRGGRSW
jgi:hypothetical protein